MTPTHDRLCPGTGAPVAKTAVDGGHVTTCPACRRWRLAYPIFEDPAGRYTVEAHFIPPLPRRTPGASLPLFEAVL